MTGSETNPPTNEDADEDEEEEEEEDEAEAEAEEVTVHRPTIREDFLTEVVVTSAQEQQDLEGVLVMLLLIKVMTLNRAVC